jgi:hypothetical protein
MDNSKYKKFTSRFEELIKEFNEEILPFREEEETYPFHFVYPNSMYDKLQGWLMKSENILVLTFKEKSIQVKRFRDLRDNLQGRLYDKLTQIKGLLEACLSDINGGFLQGQEFIIANEVFDSVLEEANFFIKQQNKDIAAILLRIVLEDSIKRIGKKEGVDIEKKASIINDELKGLNYYQQTTWRQIQAWLDIGNFAAHGDFEKYSLQDVELFYQGLMNFITNHF